MNAKGGPLGNKIEDQNGYKFTNCRVMKNGDKTWRCSKLWSAKCKAEVVTRGDFIILQKKQHNHGPEERYISDTFCNSINRKETV